MWYTASFEKSQSNQYQRDLDSTMGGSDPSFTAIKYWVAELNVVTTPGIVKKIHKMVLDDRQLKLHEVADKVEHLKKRCTSHID